MALMIGSLYDALKEAGVDDTLARSAAEEVVSHKVGVDTIESKLNTIKRKLNLLTWMMATNIVLTSANLWWVFTLDQALRQLPHY